MYGTFRDAERLGGLTHRGVVVDDIVGYPYSSFFNIVFQRKTMKPLRVKAPATFRRFTFCCGRIYVISLCSAEIYFNNKYEFWFDFYDLIPVCLLMFAVFAGVSFLLAFIISRINTKLYHVFLVVYLIAFLCTYAIFDYKEGDARERRFLFYDYNDPHSFL